MTRKHSVARAAHDALATRLRELGASASVPAVIDGSSGARLDWRDIAATADRWQEAMAPGRPVGLVLADPLDFARHYLAAIAAGVPIAPIDPRATASELERTIEVLGIADVVLEPDRDAAVCLGGSGLRLWVDAGASLCRRAGSRQRSARFVPPGVAEVLATSGTTGTPKLVPLSATQMLHVSRQIVTHHGLGPTDRGFSPLPLFHINAQIVGLLSALVSGGSLIVQDRFHRTDTWEVALERGATWLNLVPAILTVLAGAPAPPAQLSERVRFVRSASAALPLPVLRRFEEHTGMRVLETYGLTEAASQVAANPLEPALRRAGSAGRAVGTWLRVCGEDGAPLPAGELGAIEIAGRGVIDHYLGADGAAIPARTAAGWFRTGDSGRLDADGYVYLAGRRDDIVNRGGELIEPREVEDLLRAEPLVADVALVGRPHAVLGQEPVAFVRPVRPLGADERAHLGEALGRRAAAELSAFKRPVEYRFVDVFPLGRTGKVVRRRLAELLVDRPATATA